VPEATAADAVADIGAVVATLNPGIGRCRLGKINTLALLDFELPRRSIERGDVA